MEIACIAIVDYQDKLEFIDYYLKTSDQSLFKFQSFAVLHHINIQLQKRLSGQTPDPYIGWIYQIYLPENDYDIYGYVTVSQLKIILFLKQNKQQDKLNIQPIFEKIYGLYRASNYNPFGQLNLQRYLQPIVRDFNN